MADKYSKLGAVLSLNDSDMSFTERMQQKIKSMQGDGVSMQTHRAMKDAGIGATEADVQDGVELARRYSQKNEAIVRKDATIVLPNGNKVTPLEYQKLQQFMLKRGG